MHAQHEAAARAIRWEYGQEAVDGLADLLALPFDARLQPEPWRNDACPKWEAVLPNGRRVTLWADWPEPGARELPGSPRFLATVATTDEKWMAGEYIHEEGTDNAADVPAVVARAFAAAS